MSVPLVYTCVVIPHFTWHLLRGLSRAVVCCLGGGGATSIFFDHFYVNDPFIFSLSPHLPTYCTPIRLHVFPPTRHDYEAMMIVRRHEVV